MDFRDDGESVRLTDLCAVRTRFFDGFFADAGAAGSRFAADYRGSSEHNDVADYLQHMAGTTLTDLVATTGLRGLRPDDLGDALLSTRYVTAVRNAPAPMTLEH